MRRALILALLVCTALCARGQSVGHPQIAITFDDLPAHGPLPPGETRLDVIHSILHTLKSEDMPPVYGFVNGFRVAGYPYQIKILQQWRAAGQQLGNHTWSHPSLDDTGAAKYIADIARDEPLLSKVDPDGDWHWFRYPYLQEGNTLPKRQQVRQYLLDHHYQIAEVTLDFEDYLWNDPYARCAVKQKDGIDESANMAWLEKSYLAKADEFSDVFRQLSQKLYGHDIPYVLLLHVGAFDAKMLPRLIALFRSKGYVFITLEEAQKDPALRFDPDIGYPGGGTLEELVSQIQHVNFPDNTKPYKKIDAMCR